MAFWCYMLHCRGGAFYVGHTDDLERRINEHRSGLISGFSSRRLPVELVWSEYFQTRDEAKDCERKLKGWSRAKKLALIRGDWEAVSRFAKAKDGPSTSSGQSGVEVCETVLAFLRKQAALALPTEACGMLFGDTHRIERATLCANVHPSPRTHFEIDAAALIAAHKVARDGGPQIAGYWHSHPTGNTSPSPTDQAAASNDGRVWAIVARGEVAFWRDAPGGFEALSSQVVDG